MVLQLNYTCKEETRAVHIHCYSHYLNLAEVGAINLKLMRSELDVVHKTSKLVYYSPSRDGLFQALKVRLDQLSRRMYSMLTRLSVLANSLASILSSDISILKLSRNLKTLSESMEQVST